MKIYIDFDDVICETARKFCVLAEELFGIVKPYEEVRYFNLQKAFGLDDGQYDILMVEGHKPDILLSLEETEHASQTINSWLDAGHTIEVVTGRAFGCHDVSRRWLDEHGLSRVPLFHVDKYGRENFMKDGTFNMTLTEMYARGYELAIDDSPAAFEHLVNMKDCTVAVFDRPWNAEVGELPPNFVRCDGWSELNRLVNEYQLFGESIARAGKDKHSQEV